MWDCEIEEEHYNALSGCCGSEEHSDVKGMCGACNEWSGWYCSMCDEDVKILPQYDKCNTCMDKLERGYQI